MQIALQLMSVNVTMTLCESQLNNNSNIRALLQNHTAPDVIVACLPGSVTREGNRRDNNIATNIGLILQEQLSQNHDVLIFANKSSPTWHLPGLHSVLTNMKVFSYNVPWCSLGLQHNDRHIQREERIITTLNMPDSFRSGGKCEHEQHVTLKAIPNRLKVQFAQRLWLSITTNDAQGHGGRADKDSAEPEFETPAIGVQSSFHADDAKTSSKTKTRHAIKKKKQKAVVEEHFDDCGENAAAVDMPEEDQSTVLFEDNDALTEHCSSDEQFPETQHTGTRTHQCTYFDSMHSAMHAFHSEISGRRYHHDVCQLFGGNGTIIRLCIGRNLSGENFDAQVGIDLSDPVEIKQFWTYLKTCRPKVLVGSPPCTPFDAWSNINRIRAHDTWRKSYRLALPLAKLTAEACKFQLRNKRDFIVENPLTSKLWELPCWKEIINFPQTVSSKIHQCMYGLIGEDGKHVYKPTRFVASDVMLLTGLRQTCDGSHIHGRLEGSINGRSRCRTAQTWPLALNRYIVSGIVSLLKLKHHQQHRFLVFAVGKHQQPLVQEKDSAPSHCPGCRAHARRDDPRHNRHPSVCKFVGTETKLWSCAACRIHKHSRHSDHTYVPDECQWAHANPRIGNVFKKTVNRRPEDQETTETVVEDKEPPVTPLGKWSVLNDKQLIDQLVKVMHKDGWNIVANCPVLITTNAYSLQSCEPRFDSSKYLYRSTFGYFPDFGGWYTLELNQLWSDVSRIRRYLGHAVPVMLCVFGITGQEIVIQETSAALADAANAAAAADEDRQTDERQVIERTTRKQEHDPRVQLIPFEPAQPINEAEEEPNIPMITDQQISPIDPPDWSNWQLSKALSKLKSQNRSDVIQTLRLLHVRFWHASSSKLRTLLMSANVEKSVIDLIPTVVMTCKICRQWQRPEHRAMTSSRISLDFNAAVQVDLLFMLNNIVLHAIDEATRWSVAVIIPDKQASTITKALTMYWFRIFGAPDLIISDQEGGLYSEEASIWSERWGCQFKFKPKGSHASVVERHHAILRDIVHRVHSECSRSMLEVSLDEILSESTFAKNALSYVNGVTPYMAVLGRQPRVLSDLETAGLSMIRDEAGPTKHATKLREISISAMIEATSNSRIQRSLHNHARVTGEQMSLEVNDLVDIHRTPANKDLTGWRGPCRVVNTTGVSEGYVDVKWGGRVMSVRIADVRKHILFAHIYVQLTSEPEPWRAICQHLRTLQNTCQLFGWIHGKSGTMLSTAARSYPVIFQAIIRVGQEFAILGRCTGGRLGVGVKSAAGIPDAEHSVLIWCSPDRTEDLSMMTLHPNNPINFARLFGNNWQAMWWLQLYGTEHDNGIRPEEVQPVPSNMSTSTIQEQPHNIPVPSSSMSIGSEFGRMSIPSDVTIPAVISSNSIPGPQISSISSQHDHKPTHPSSSSSSSQQFSRSRSRYSQPSSLSSSSIQPDVKLPTSTMPVSSSSSSWSRSRSRNHIHSNTSHSADTDATIPYPEDMSNVPSNVPSAANQHVPPAAISGGTEDSLETITYDSDAEDNDRNEFSGIAELQYLLDETESENHWNNIHCNVESPHVVAWWDMQDCCEQIISSQVYFSDETSADSIGNYSEHVQLEFSSCISAWLCDPVFIAKDEVTVYTVQNMSKITVGVEKTYDALSPSEVRQHWKLCEEAIRKELQSFAELDVFYPVAKSCASNIMSSRWVLRWKQIGESKSVKARLTVRGFQDLSAETIETYAGTASRWGQRLIPAIAIQNGWELFTWDVSTAFLQGCSFDELASITGEPIREVATLPPKGSEQYFREMPGFADVDFNTHCLGMKKAVYGLKDAPRAWRIKLDLTLKELGGTPLYSDRALYTWHDSDGKLIMIISTHVDDKKGAGTPAIRQKVKAGLEKAFGKLKEQVKQFEHCGILHEQLADRIILHQNHYVKQLNHIKLAELKGLAPDHLLDDRQKLMFASVLGGLSWLIQTRPDIAVYVCALQRVSKKPTVEHMERLNKIVRWVKKHPASLAYFKLQEPLKLLVISDSAFKKEDQTGTAMRGAIISICEAKHNDNPGGRMQIIEFFSRKQRRVTRSTYAAELNALADAVETGRLVNIAYTEIMMPKLSATRLSALESHGQLKLQLEACIDAKAVFDSLRMSETKTPAEGSLLMILLSLKEQLRSFLLRKLWWIHTEDMLSDGLTKGVINRNALLFTAGTGNWVLTKSALEHSEKIHVPLN